MHMLFPFRRVCASFVDLRPFGVISLGGATGNVETMVWVVGGKKCATYYSVTSSRTISMKKRWNPDDGCDVMEELTDEVIKAK